MTPALAFTGSMYLAVCCVILTVRGIGYLSEERAASMMFAFFEAAFCGYLAHALAKLAGF